VIEAHPGEEGVAQGLAREARITAVRPKSFLVATARMKCFAKSFAALAMIAIAASVSLVHLGFEVAQSAFQRAADSPEQIDELRVFASGDLELDEL
jgi:hypothetical protein